MKTSAIFITFVASLIVLTGCAKRELRGHSSSSSDGKTYLVVDDDNEGKAGPIKIDGKEWLTPLHSPGLIEPGIHKIQTGDGSSIQFEILSGTTFHFDYWGP